MKRLSSRFIITGATGYRYVACKSILHIYIKVIQKIPVKRVE